MEILLLVVIMVVGASALYVAATFNTRTRQNTTPLIDGAIKVISEKIEVTGRDLSRQLQGIANELRQDRELTRLDRDKIQERLDQADSRISSIASRFFAELETIERLSKQIGAQQDQFSSDLRRLDHRVVQLGESPVRQSARKQQTDGTLSTVLGNPETTGDVPRPSAGHANEEISEDISADTPLTVPGTLYAERLRFSIIPTDTESSSERWVRIQVERKVAELPDEQLGDLGNASVITYRAEHDKGFRDRLGKAVSDYFADKWGDPLFKAVTKGWVTQNSFPETAAAEACNRISHGLASIVEKPLEKIATDIRLPGPTITTGIGADLILQPVTKPLGQAAEVFEAVGVVAGVATGLHPVALASAKMLVEGESHRLVARGIEAVAREVFGKRDKQSPCDGPKPPDTPEVQTKGTEPQNVDKPDDTGTGPYIPYISRPPERSPKPPEQPDVPEITIEIGGPWG